MNYLSDLHTHTIASGHAYSTITEMAQAAAKKGIRLLGITEHAMALPGTCHLFYFQNMKVIPRQQCGIELMFGSELNVMDYEGNVDMDDRNMEVLDYAVASFHPPCLTPGSAAENTRAACKVMEKPRVFILGHPDDGRFPMNYEEIVRAAKATGTLIELNNSSLNPNGFRQNAFENDKIILELCMKHDVPVIVNSDAHIDVDVGNCCYAEKALDAVGFPEELIINNRIDEIKKRILTKRTGL